MEPGRGFDLHGASFPVLSVLCGLGGYEGCGFWLIKTVLPILFSCLFHCLNTGNQPFLQVNRVFPTDKGFM